MKSTTLLVAAAALAVEAISAGAQVYSANVVGYVNVVFTNNNNFVLASNPLDDGTNTANSILAALPNKSSIQTWNGSTFDLASKGSSGFTPNPSIPPGAGFFVKVAGTSVVTNTFVGNVVPNPGGNSTNSLPSGTFVLVGSALAVGGTLNDVGTNALNLIATLPNKSSIQLWDVASQSFVLSSKGSSGFTPNLPYVVGQGFFLKSNSATNWVQSFAP
ncbi:MAG: hypothetical protein WDM80_07380 [Limisphaerales bacterium]